MGRSLPIISSPNDNEWFQKFEENLKRYSVQSVEQASFQDQINSIMGNSKSKYPSVQAAVDDMKKRSGLTDYLEKANKTNSIPVKKANNATSENTPRIFKKFPQVEKTIRNYIESTRGNLSIPAILDRVRSIHKNDVGPDDWEDDSLIRFISKVNLQAKSQGMDNFRENDLGKIDHTDQEHIDPSNVDPLHILNPAKM